MIPVRPSDAGWRVPLKVTPKGSRNEIQPYREADGWVSIKVTAAPEDGKANKAVIALLAKTLKLPKRAVTLVSGETSRQKTIALDGDESVLVALAEAMQTQPEACFRRES